MSPTVLKNINDVLKLFWVGHGGQVFALAATIETTLSLVEGMKQILLALIIKGNYFN
jgi:hypothetical protein